MQRKSVFLSKHAIENLEPVVGAVVISISDSSQDEAKLKPGWEKVHRFHFIDAGYDAKALRWVGANHKYIYASYFNRELAIKLSDVIEKTVNGGSNTFIVNCHAGQSRSAAVAKYLYDQYGYLPFNSPMVLSSMQHSELVPNFEAMSNYNQMVYALLMNPKHFDDVLREIEQSEPPVLERVSLLKTLIDWIRP